jgi:broad specificity phosphatase PhoE
MSNQLPVIYIARHGETAWTLTGQHTGLTDLPLTPQGERNARALADRLKGLDFDNDLVEWNYGDYEGLRSAEIRAKRPDWQLFRDGCPGGESPAQVMARADNVVKRVREAKGDVLLFSSGHFIRMLAARWIGIEPSVHSMSFLLSTASLSAVGYDQDLSHPVIRLWNDNHHVNPNGIK